MKSAISIFFLLFAVIATSAGDPEISLRQYIEGKPIGAPYKIDGVNLDSGKELKQFYVNRNYVPAWFKNNFPGKNGYVLVDYIRHIDRHGLLPEDYNLSLIEKYIWKTLSYLPTRSEDVVKLDILLTDAFMTLGSHLHYGKVDPEKEGADWKMQRKEAVLHGDLILEKALASNQVGKQLDLLAPSYHSYWRMSEELSFFLSLNDQPWPEIKVDTSIKPGVSHPIIPKIRQRLINLRYRLPDSTSEIYDSDLEKQVKIYQNDWGLNTDGVIGKTTIEVLNLTPAEFVNRLKVNMERLRWFPLQGNEKYIIVNIASRELHMIRGNDTLISMRVIVGKEPRKTPVFNDKITYMVFSPTWTVPKTILEDDVIPQLLKGPGYLEEKNMKLLRRGGLEIAYSEVDWSMISKANFPYMVRQDPGPSNALGKVKFMFPNPYDVYIHDSPSKGPFASDNRSLSSGCVRVEKPFDLAVLLLADEPGWSPERIRSAMQQNREETVHLKVPVDVMLVYLTAWADGKDRIQFRKDIYHSDEPVLTALSQKPEKAKFRLSLW